MARFLRRNQHLLIALKKNFLKKNTTKYKESWQIEFNMTSKNKSRLSCLINLNQYCIILQLSLISFKRIMLGVQIE